MKKLIASLLVLVFTGTIVMAEVPVADPPQIAASAFADVEGLPIAFDALDDIRGGYEPIEIDPVKIDTTIPKVGDITIIIKEIEVRRYPNNDHIYATVRYVAYRHFRGMDRMPMD